MENSVFPLPQYLEDAFVLMEMNQPPYPRKLIEELGAYQGKEGWHEQPKPYFKGWVGTVDGMTRYNADMGLYPEDLTNISYIGMWCGVTTLKFIIYCVIPSMVTGVSRPGEICEMGKERIKIGQYTPDELDGFVVAGWNKMQEMIREHGEYVPTFKASGIARA